MTIKSIDLQEYYRLLKVQKLTSALLGAKNTKEVASIIINEGFDALGSICGDVSILDQETKLLKHIAERGYPQELVTNFYKIVHKIPSLTMDVVRSGKPMFIHDFRRVDKKYEFGHNFVKLTQSRSMVLLPLLVRKRAFGCLQFSFKHVQEFTDKDKDFMLHLAAQCAQALERIIALENEKNARNELKAILGNIDDAVVVRNKEGEIVFVNSAAVSLHGCEEEKELLHLSLKEYSALSSKILDEKGNEVGLRNLPFIEALQKKKRIKRTFFVVLRKTKEAKWLKIASIPIFDKKETIRFVVSVMNDITEEKERENSKDEFFGIASHELKTPVTSLKAYTQLLEKRFRITGDDETAKVLQKMDFQIDKLTHLIRDLLDITKIEAGRMHVSSELFECNILVADVIEQMQLTAGNHEIVFEKSGDVVLFADKERIAQVIANFLTNAIKYSPEGQKVIVKMKKSKEEVTIYVQDFGIGITEEGQKHVFERYFRERNFQQDTFPGLGLGLYIASQIIKRHRGTIGVKSKKGKGSTFFFSLPRYQK